MENINEKPFMVVQCPVATRSGYGERSRDLVRALIALDKYEIKIISTRWGATPMNALTSNDTDLLDRLLLQPLTRQPDIYVQITVPNEFQPIGKYNIGVTAGIETTLCDHSWLEGCNKMNLVLVSSDHAKRVFEETVYNKADSQGNIVDQLRLKTPVEVLFEGIDLSKFNKEYKKSEIIDNTFKSIPESFCFLFCGHWLPGAEGEDRKNVSGLVRTFYETFKNNPFAPALVLKTSGGAISVTDRDVIKSKIESIKNSITAKTLPNVYVLYGDLTDSEMNDLYNHPKVKCHITLTKGEGFGRPLLEAALTNKPIIASCWSGHLDFLSPETSILVPGTLTPIHPSAVWQGVLNAEAQWFTVDYAQVVLLMKDVVKNYKQYSERSRKTYHYIKTNFSWDGMKSKLDSILTSRLPSFPKQIQLQLPKLKKIELPKLEKVESES
jgi:glycosyltransferase involved in cell wall biosynthesis